MSTKLQWCDTWTIKKVFKNQSHCLQNNLAHCKCVGAWQSWFASGHTHTQILGCYLKIRSPVAKQTRERWTEANQEVFDPLQQNWEVSSRLVENVARYRKITAHTVTHNIWWSLSIDQPSNCCSWSEEANHTAAVICSCHGNNYVFTLMAKFLRIVALFIIADHAGMFFSSVHLL